MANEPIKSGETSRLEELEAQKRTLVSKIKEVNSALRQKKGEFSSLISGLKGKGRSGGRRLREEVEHIEFRIATAAYTPAQEKALLKHLKIAQAELKKALEADGTRQEADKISAEIDKLKAEQAEIDGKLGVIRAELDTLYQQILKANKERYEQGRAARNAERGEHSHKHRTREREEYRRREKAELEPYMKGHDDFVSLEEIAEIKKKSKE